jgi:hypothetical protein
MAGAREAKTKVWGSDVKVHAAAKRQGCMRYRSSSVTN